MMNDEPKGIKLKVDDDEDGDDFSVRYGKKSEGKPEQVNNIWWMDTRRGTTTRMPQSKPLTEYLWHEKGIL
jgi:hypothetical protein